MQIMLRGENIGDIFLGSGKINDCGGKLKGTHAEEENNRSKGGK